METSIHRIESNAAIQSGAVRKAGPRRQRGSQEHSFEEELSQGGKSPRAEGPDEEARHEELPVAPPAEDETGTRIDLVG